MNFHKTIGFLATLLLTLGLGVPDSFAQELQSVSLSLNGTTGSDADPPAAAATFADNVGTTVVTVSVTATYDDDLESGETKTVKVDVKAMGTTAEVTDYASQPAFPLTITATVPADDLTTAVGSATIILTPVADTDTDDELIVLEATIGDETDEAILALTDSEVSVTDLTLTLNGQSDGSGDATFADNVGATVVTVAVTATFESALPATETRTVMVGVKTGDETTAEAGDYSTVPSLPISITLTGDGSTTATGSVSIAVTPAIDDDYDDELVVLEATVANSAQTAEARLTITDVDINVTGVSLSLNGIAGSDADPPTAAATFADNVGAAAVTVAVTVTFESALPATETRTVMVDVKDDGTTAEAGDYSIIPSLPISITLTGDGSTTATGSINFALTLKEDADLDNENVVLEATVKDSDETDEAIVSITDADNSATSITLSLNGATGSDADPPTAVATFADNIGATIVTVAVTATFESPLADAETRTVMVDVKDGGTTAEAGDYSTIPSLPISITLTGDGSTNPLVESLNIVVTPARDTDAAAEMIVFEATIGGTDPDEAILEITDSGVNPDPVVGAVTGVAFSPATLSLTEGTAFTGTATVTVNVEAGLAQTISVALTADGAALADLGINSPVAVSVKANATSGTADISVSYTPPEDDNFAGETITITGTVGTMSDDLTLNIADNDMGEGAVTGVAFSPATLSLTEGTAFIGTATVTVNVEAGVAQMVSVALTADGAALADLGINSPVAVSIDTDATSGTADIPVNYTPPTDADVDDEMVTVTGTVGGQSGTLTLNVADSTPSMGTIKVFTSLESIRENSRTRNVVVTASLDAPPATGTTVMVDVTVTGGTAPMTTQIPIVGPALSNTATVAITPVNDEVFTTSSITVTGSVTGYQSGMASIDVVDDDASLGTLSFSAISPPSATLNGGAQNLTLTVKVWLASPDTPIPNPLVVNVATNKGKLASSTISITNIKKNVDFDPATRKADGSGKVVLSLAADDVDAAGEITVTASAAMYETGTRTIPIRARGALDVAGYRAVIARPTGTAWANIGNDKILVDVTRHGNVAYPWGDFESIKVSVRDTAHADFELETVTASGFNREDNGAVTFQEPASTSRGDVIWRGNDLIRFEIRIRAHSAYSSQDRAANGQYLGAYAHVEFTSGRETAAIETRDDETSVYPADPSLVDDAKVGDGRLIRIDNLAPTHSGVAAVRVTSGDEVGSSIDATVGDEIRVAVAVSQTNLFRESGLRIQLQILDGSGTVNGKQLTAAQRNNPSKNEDFTTSQVISAASTSDSLIHTYTVTEGYFKVKLDDFVEGVGAKGTSLDLNNARAQVRAGVKDQAGNFKFSGWTRFDIDSRSPGVSILYPSADPDSIYEHTHPLRFSGAVESIVEGQNVDDHLNPLAIVVDEDISELKVFAVGADTLDITDQLPSDAINDSMAVYDTSKLSSPKKDGEGDDDKYPGNYVPSSANRAGTEIELAVIATDVLGNTTKVTIANVTHDASPPVITDWFPKNSLLPEDQINDATPPIFTLSEDVDSIAVTFEGSNGSDVTKERGGVTTKGEDSIDFSGALTDEISYDMTIFVRDLVGNVFITPPDSSMNMKFNAEFDNPVANRFNISTETDSVIAGQANILTIQAEDYDAGSDSKRNALTYKNAARISAWDASGGAAESVWFEGTGVTDDADSPDGVAMLSAADWRIGKRDVTVKSNKATGFVKILVQHLDSGMGDTAVVGFDGAKDSLYVGAADFAAFDITPWEEGVEGPAPEIWGNYTLRVVPVDRHGNPSVRAFKADFDSLNVLDTRAKDKAFEYKNGIDVEIVGVPTIEDFALLILSIEKEGATYDLVAPDDRRSQTVQVRVVNTALQEGDTRSQNVRSSAKFKISAPLEPVLTLWVPGSDVDEAGNDVVIPADPGDVTVTVAAAGFNAGDMVTFTRNGTAGDPVTADDDGVARLMITAGAAGSTTVSASNGVYSTDELTITFVDTPAEPARKSYVDANGAPVYLISDADMTVGVDDFLALVAAFGSSDGDDNYNAQADVDDDGDVDVDDFVEFIGSFGRTAVGPATKPLVLLPGINENAEFSLSLGSERVVAGELVAVDVSLANVAALVGYGFALNYETDNFEFVSVAPADEDLLKSTGGETLFHHIVSDGQITVANGLFNGTAVSGGGDAVRFVFRVLREFEDNARFEIANGLVFDPGQLQNPAVVAGVLELQSTPREFALHQNFPNPFNPDTTIKYDLAESADVTLQIYNVLGQVVRTLVASEAQNAGRYQIRWNGMDDRGVPVSSGIYFYQISADGKFSDVRKLMLLK